MAVSFSNTNILEMVLEIIVLLPFAFLKFNIIQLKLYLQLEASTGGGYMSLKLISM